MTSKRAGKLALTRSAIASINEIEKLSIDRWGKKVAERSINDLEAGLIRLQEQPELLCSVPDFHSEFCFYRVNKHILVCDRRVSSIFVLAVIHSTQDIPERVAQIEPKLVQEVELLHRKLKAADQTS